MRTVPAAVVEGSELIHLGGGETVPCPGIETMHLRRRHGAWAGSTVGAAAGEGPRAPATWKPAIRN